MTTVLDFASYLSRCHRWLVVPVPGSLGKLIYLIVFRDATVVTWSPETLAPEEDLFTDGGYQVFISMPNFIALAQVGQTYFHGFLK